MTRTHLKESLGLLNELAFDMVERVLMGQVGGGAMVVMKGVAESAVPQAAVCSHCGRVCASLRGLAKHMNACAARQSGPVIA